MDNHEKALEVFNGLCKTFEKHDWQYEKEEAKLTLRSGAVSADLPMEFDVIVEEDSMLVLLVSRLPFSVPEDRRRDMAVAVSVANNALADGCFDFDICGGRLFFRMTSCFLDSTLGEDLFRYMLFASCRIIDEYNDKFLSLATGRMPVEEFIEKCRR